MNRFILWTLSVLFFGSVALTPALLIYLYNQQPPVTYSSRKVLTPVVPPGGILKIEISSDLSRKCEAMVFRTIIDSNGALYDLSPEARPLKTNYVIEVPVPLGVMPGPASYSARVEWRCNPVQHWFPQEIIQKNLNFTIAPADGQFPDPQQQGVYPLPITKSELARVQP